MKDDLLHGGALDVIAEQYPNAPAPWIDLSTGINPWPWPVQACEQVSLNQLPTKSAYQDCAKAMSQYLNTRVENILLSPGSELLIRLLPTIISPRHVVIHSPTYGDHYQAWKAAESHVLETRNPLAHAAEADCVVICNPNNPDGHIYSRKELTDALEVLSSSNGNLIVDEAYADLDPNLSLADLAGQKGLIILRSTGKFFGLAGLRLGALLAHETILNTMRERLGVWSISSQALHIGTAAYQDFDWQIQTRSKLKSAAQRLDDLLENSAVNLVGGTSLFRFLETENAHQAWDILASQGIYTRRFSWSSKHLRIGLPQNEDASNRLAQALSLLK